MLRGDARRRDAFPAAAGPRPEPPLPTIEEIELPDEDAAEFAELADRLVKELGDEGLQDVSYHVRVLATCARRVGSLPDQIAAKVPALVRDGVVALLKHKSLEGEAPLLVNALVHEALRYCVRMIPNDCAPLMQLMAECVDSKHPLYREAADGEADDEDDGDTTGWRMSLDFADRVDALRTLWDKSRVWATGQIIETNPATQQLMVRYDGGYDGEEDWIERFSADIAPYKTKSVKAAKELEAWKAGLVVGARVDLQDFCHRSWFAGTVSARLEAGAYSPRGNYYQHDTSAHIKVTVVGNNGIEEESELISVNSPRLAKYGTRASGGEQK